MVTSGIDLALALSEERQKGLTATRSVLDGEVARCDLQVRERINRLGETLSSGRGDFKRLGEWGGDAYRSVVTDVIAQLEESVGSSL